MMDISGPDQEQARRMAVATEHLVSEGMRVLDHGWKNPEGTIDIVAEEKGTLVVVILDSTRAIALPPKAVLKRQRRMAVAWMNAHGTNYARIRVDTIQVTLLPMGQSNLEHIQAVDAGLY